MGILSIWYKALMQLISSKYIKNTIIKSIEKSPFRKKYSRKMTGGQYNKIAKDAVIKVIGPMKAGFIKSNFEAGGVPKFAGNTLSTIFTKSIRGGGYQPMVNTGLFKKSVIDNPKIQSVPGSLEPILLPRGVTPRILTSMSILKNGGVINIPRTRKMRRFFFAMSKLAEGSEVGGIFKAAALSKEQQLVVKLPARDWTKLTFMQKLKLEKAKVEVFELVCANYLETGKWIQPKKGGK